MDVNIIKMPLTYIGVLKCLWFHVRLPDCDIYLSGSETFEFEV